MPKTKIENQEYLNKLEKADEQIKNNEFVDMDIELFNERINAPDRFSVKPKTLDEAIDYLDLDLKI